MRGVETEAKFAFRMPERGAADGVRAVRRSCLLYTSDAADEL